MKKLLQTTSTMTILWSGVHGSLVGRGFGLWNVSQPTVNIHCDEAIRLTVSMVSGDPRSTGLYIGSAADVSPLIKAPKVHDWIFIEAAPRFEFDEPECASIDTFKAKMTTRIESLGLEIEELKCDSANNAFSFLLADGRTITVYCSRLWPMDCANIDVSQVDYFYLWGFVPQDLKETFSLLPKLKTVLAPINFWHADCCVFTASSFPSNVAYECLQTEEGKPLGDFCWSDVMRPLRSNECTDISNRLVENAFDEEPSTLRMDSVVCLPDGRRLSDLW